MLVTETLVCRIPTEDAIKFDKIYCATSPTNNPEILGDNATWASVLVTAIMAIFAYHAWTTSKKQLEATREVAINEQRVPALLDLLEALDVQVRQAHARKLVSEDEQAERVALTRLFDRWSLTYMDMMRSNELRHVLEDIVTIHHSAYDAILRIENFGSDVDPFTEETLFERVTDSWGSIAQMCDDIRETALDLHSKKINETQAIEQFKSLSRTSEEAKRDAVQTRVKAWGTRFNF